MASSTSLSPSAVSVLLSSVHPMDQRAIQGHMLTASSGFFAASVVCVLTAPAVKQLCLSHAGKFRGPLQQLAGAMENELGALLGVQKSPAASPNEDSSTTVHYRSSHHGHGSTTNGKSQFRPVGPYSTPAGEEEEGEDGEQSPSGSLHVPVTTASSLAVEPSEVTLMNVFGDMAATIINARLEDNREFGRTVGHEMVKVQRKVSRILFHMGIRTCTDIVACYLICCALDKARATSGLGQFAFFKTDVIGTGGFGSSSSSAPIAAADYFTSSTFRFYLFTSFSFGTAVNHSISYVLGRIGLSSIDRLLSVGHDNKSHPQNNDSINSAATSAVAVNTAESKKGLMGWFSRVAFFYDDQHNTPITKRKVILFPFAFPIRSLIFQIASHGILNSMRLPSGLYPISESSYQSVYVHTLSKLGPNEILYWVFLEKFVWSTTILGRLLLTGQLKSIPQYVRMLSAVDKPNRVFKAINHAAAALDNALLGGWAFNGGSKQGAKKKKQTVGSYGANGKEVKKGRKSNLSSIAASNKPPRNSPLGNGSKSNGSPRSSSTVDDEEESMIFSPSERAAAEVVTVTSSVLELLNAPSLATRITTRVVLEGIRMGVIFTMCAIGVKAANYNSGGAATTGTDSSSSSPSAFFPLSLAKKGLSAVSAAVLATLKVFHVNVLCRVVDEQKGAAYIWSLLL